MSADEFVPYGYGLVITYRTCSDILPVDSEGKFENYKEGDDVVPSPESRDYSERFIHTTDDGVRIITSIGNFFPVAVLWSLHPEPLEWYREQVEHLCLNNQDLYTMIEEVAAWT